MTRLRTTVDPRPSPAGAGPGRRRALPAIVLLLAALLVGALSTTAVDAATASTPAEQQFANELNRTRAEEGLDQVRVSLQMVRIARDWSRTMAAADEMSHRPNLSRQVEGPWTRIGENVGWTTVSGEDAVPAAVSRLHQAFLDSPAHRANVLGDYNQVGVGVVIDGGKLWVTFNFLKGPIGQFPLFPDAEGSTHEGDIERVWLANVAQGCQFSRYCPADEVTRAQMATFLGRALDLTPVAGTQFQDVDPQSPFSGYINAVARAGIARGCATDRYCPGRLVTRAEMGTFLARALQLAPESQLQFIDVPPTSVHFENINAIAEAGITAGCDATGTRYCPDAGVPRAQMASFLARAFKPPVTFWEATSGQDPDSWADEDAAAETQIGDDPVREEA